MGIDINQHRGSIGRHYFASLTADIINKIHNTKNRYLHISITELSESKVGSTDFLPATLSLISQGSLALKLNNEQNVTNGKGT
jgi:hypothetical protein